MPEGFGKVPRKTGPIEGHHQTWDHVYENGIQPINPHAPRSERVYPEAVQGQTWQSHAPSYTSAVDKSGQPIQVGTYSYEGVTEGGKRFRVKEKYLDDMVERGWSKDDLHQMLDNPINAHPPLDIDYRSTAKVGGYVDNGKADKLYLEKGKPHSVLINHAEDEYFSFSDKNNPAYTNSMADAYEWDLRHNQGKYGEKTRRQENINSKVKYNRQMEREDK